MILIKLYQNSILFFSMADRSVMGVYRRDLFAKDECHYNEFQVNSAVITPYLWENISLLGLQVCLYGIYNYTSFAFVR